MRPEMAFAVGSMTKKIVAALIVARVTGSTLSAETGRRFFDTPQAD
jgi:hypothetical protein